MFDDETKPRSFHGFRSPTYTQVPDELFDELLPDLSLGELRVLLYIIRRTFGFKRDCDNISLSQMLHGLKSRDGRQLDRGVGLSKKTLLAAINSLEERKIILTERRSSAERGDEPTTYRLNVLPTARPEKTTPPVGEKLHQGGGAKTPPGGRGKNSPTQQTESRETDSGDGAVPAALVAFGLSRGIAAKIAGAYPSDYVMAKLELANWLLDQGSHLITRNAPGWLRRAIEEDYQAPAEYDRSPSETEPDSAEATVMTETPAGPPAEVTERHEAEGRMVEEKQATIQELRVVYPPRPIDGVGLTTQAAWQMALEALRPQVSAMAYRNWLTTAELVMVNHELATIAAPTQFQVEWLTTRLDPQIARALRSVLGRSMKCTYVTVRELLSPEGPPGG